MTPSLRLIRLEDRVAPAVATWDGGGANDNWTTAANWVGDVAPQPRDDLVFPASVPRATNVNDFPAGTGFGSIRLGDPAYVIAGNDIALSGGIFVSFNTALTQTPQVGLGITLTAFQSFIATFGTGLTLTGSVDLNGQTLSASANTFRDRPRDPDLGNLTFAGPIRGAGDLVLGGIGVVVLKAANTYTGPTQIRGGCTLLASPAGLGAAGAGNETTVESGGGLCVDFPYSLDACPEAITFAAHEPGKASLDARGGTLSGPLALAGPNLFQGQGVTIDSVVGETGGPQHLTIFASTGFVGAEPFGDGRMVFGSESVLTYTGGTQIVHGEVRFDGTGNGPVVVPDGIVSGDGAIGAATLGRGAGVAPARTSADPLSTLTVNGDFSLDENSAFSLTIVHFLPDGRSDGVIVHGAVRLNGILRIPVSGYAAAIPAGTHYRIVDNDGADPVVGSFVGMPEGQIVASAGGRHLRITYDGGDGNDVDLVADGVDTPGRFAVGAGPGGLPIVNFYDGGGTLLRSFLAYDGSFRGGVRVATGDLNGDGYAEIVTAPGPGGGPHVKVFDSATGRLLTEFNAYDRTFTGGVFVATGRTNADFAPHIITGAGPGGGAHVKVFGGGMSLFFPNGPPGGQRSFFAYDPAFTGGVTVAAGDIDGDSVDEVITGAGPGGGPHVRAFDTGPARVVREFFAYDPKFTGGVFVAAGDVDGDHKADVITGTGAGGVPVVETFSGSTGALLSAFYAYTPSFFGGVNVAAIGVGAAEIVTGPGPGGGPHVRAFDLTGAVRAEWLAFDPAFRSGVFVG